MVTIIVPVYQVYQYLDECVESLMHQTYTDLEIILIDDGSTDGSEVLCDEYARRDARIKVIHQENQGLSGARNTGLHHANGEYVAFVDSDDFVAPVYIETLYKLLRKYCADIAMCAYRKGNDKKLQYAAGRVRINHYSRAGTRMKTLCMSSDKILRNWHGKYKKYETVVWNKLYRRSVFDGSAKTCRILFPEDRKHEDVLITHHIIANAGRIALTTQVLYQYRIRDNSITSGITRESIAQNLSAQKERMRFFGKKRYWRAYLNLWVGYALHWMWFTAYRWRKRL